MVINICVYLIFFWESIVLLLPSILVHGLGWKIFNTKNILFIMWLYIYIYMLGEELYLNTNQPSIVFLSSIVCFLTHIVPLIFLTSLVFEFVWCVAFKWPFSKANELIFSGILNKLTHVFSSYLWINKKFQSNYLEMDKIVFY